MKKIFFVLGFGLLPLWLAIIVVSLGGILPSRSFEYWTAAPWLVIASLPICVATFLIAVATLFIHDLTPGDQSQKLKVATKFFWSFVLIAGATGGALGLRYEYRQQDIAIEEGLALDFVKNNKTVIQKVGHSFEPSLSTASQASDGRRVRYEFSVGALYAIVSVSRLSGNPEFTLDCITPIVWVARDANNYSCMQ